MLNKLKSLLLLLLKIIIGFLLLLILTHFIGKGVNSKVPKGGINESKYLEINGTKQWINIYGLDKNNPVLLYLHGGPGFSTSQLDYAFTRKWADIYTVVTWDQRNTGLSYSKDQDKVKLSKEMFLEDGRQMTEFLKKELGKDKITILGHSWGSIFGANLVLEYPENYDAFIGTGQLIDLIDNEVEFKKEAYNWAKGDEEGLKMVENLKQMNFF